MRPSTLPIVPSTESETVKRQLKEELNNLVKGGVDTPLAYRDYLLQLVALAWDAAADFRVEDIQKQFDRIDHVKAVLESTFSEAEAIDPIISAALEILCTLRSLQVGVRTLANRILEHRELLPEEAAVLDLLVNRDCYLPSEEVYMYLKRDFSEISERQIGQILTDLFHGHLLLRLPYMGKQLRSFAYTVSAMGQRMLDRQRHAISPMATDIDRIEGYTLESGNSAHGIGALNWEVTANRD